jgi:hypothetical protein
MNTIETEPGKKVSSPTVKYTVEVDDESEIQVDVPVGMTRDAANALFIDAAKRAIGLGSSRILVISKVQREYAGLEGLFEVYMMSNDKSGYIYGTCWIEAYIT